MQLRPIVNEQGNHLCRSTGSGAAIGSKVGDAKGGMPAEGGGSVAAKATGTTAAAPAAATAVPGVHADSEDEDSLVRLTHPDGIVGPAVPADAAMAMEMMDIREFSEFVSVGHGAGQGIPRGCYGLSVFKA